MESRYKKSLLFLSLAGFLFSGYLSTVKFFSETCALNEPCPYFWGYPACYFGLGMFTALLLSSVYAYLKNVSLKNVVMVQAVISALGILFAGYFTVPEVTDLISGTRSYALGLSSCTYGLIFYVIIFVVSVRFCNKTNLNSADRLNL